MTAIDDKYASPGMVGLLGAPTGPEGAALDGGAYRHYERGSIYWAAGAPEAFELHGAIHAKFAELGWEYSALGFPIGDETGTPDGIGRFNRFQHGSIYWTPGTGAHEVHGPIHDLWSQNDSETGSGYPVTDVDVAPDFANCAISRFSSGTIIANPAVAGQTFMGDPGVGALLVVAPTNDFVAAAEPFIAHKRATGMPTFLHTLPAVDPARLNEAPYQLKGVIAEAYLYLGVRYVLLLGDASLVPTRHRATTGLPADGRLTNTWFTPTDFYYADLFKPGFDPTVPATAPTWVEPSPWDNHGNTLFDEHHWADDVRDYKPANVEAIPLVSIGRVPAHQPADASAYLGKVIAYESNPPSGFGRLSVLTDHHYYSDTGNDYLARAIIDQAHAHFTVDSIGLGWPPGEATPDQLRPGSRWDARMAAASSSVLVYIGHGGVGVWGVSSDTYGQLDNANVRTFENSTNHPIVMAAGCETSPIMGNAAEAGPYRGIDNQTHRYQPVGDMVSDNGAAPVPKPVTPALPSPYDFPASEIGSFAQGWLFNPRGGAIAFLGESAIAPDYPGTDLLGKLVAHLRRGIILGDAWAKGQMDYRTEDAHPDDRQAAPRVYLTYMHLFGDPSLRLW